MPKKILLVEDEALIAMSEAEMLRGHGYEVVIAYNGNKAVEAVAADHDLSLILMDIDLGKGMDGTEAAEKILNKKDIPVVFLSSHTEPEVVEKTEKITSYGYIVKNSGKTVLLASIRMAFRLYEAHMELKAQKQNLNTALTKYEQTAEELYEREGMLRNLMENSIDAVQLLNEDGSFLDINRTASEMTGYTREELLSMSIADIDPNYPADEFYRFWEEKPKGTSLLFETIHKHKSGKLIPVEVNGIFFEVNNKKYLFSVARDLTERKRAENLLRESEATVRKRLKAITEPEGDIETLELVDIIDVEELQLLMEDTFKVSKVGGAIVDVSGKILVCTQMEDICREFHRVHPDTVKNCLESDLALAGDVPAGTFKAYRCKNNMWDMVTPLEIGGKHLGNIYIGQFFFAEEDVDYEVFRKQARQYGFDETAYIAALDRVPRLKRETVDRAMAFYSRLARMISSLSYTTIKLSRNMVQQKQAEDALKAGHDLLNATQKIAGIGGWEWDIATDRVTWSEELFHITGLDPDSPPPQFTDDHHKIYTKKSRQKLTAATDHTLKTGEPYELYAQIIRPDGELRDVFIYGGSNFHSDGSMSGLFGIVEDITDKKQQEKQLKESEENLRITLNSIGDAVISTDIEGNIMRMNPVAENLCGWSTGDAKGKALKEVFHIVHADTGEEAENPVARVLETGKIIGLANHTMLISRDGREYQIADSAAPIRDDYGHTTGVVLVFRDVTEEYEKDRQLRERVKQLRSIEWMLSNKKTQKKEDLPGYGDLSELNKDGLILHSAGREQLRNIASEYLDLLETSSAIYEKDGSYALGIFSSGWCRLMDCASRKLCNTGDNREALESGKWLCHESCWNVSALAMREGRPVDVECSGGIRMYGVPVHVDGETIGAINFGYGSPPTDDAKLETISKKYKIPVDELRKQAEAYNPRPQFIIDYAKERIRTAATQLGRIVNLKRKEKELEKRSTLLEESQDLAHLGSWEWNIADDTWVFSEQWKQIHGVSDADLKTSKLLEIAHPEDVPYIEKAFSEAKEEGTPYNIQHRIIRADNNETRYIHALGKVEYNRDTGSPVRLIGTSQDITERKQVEVKLREALKEKEFLMKELNHRVKNSLLMVSSLISLRDSETENDLSDIQHQVEAIGLIHEKLYQTGNVTEVCIRDYFDDLLTSIFSSFSRRPVRVEVDIEEIYIPTKSAMALGLIINEIATNAIKHGFNEKEEAVFSVMMETDNENSRYTLTLSNNGNPFPEDIGLENPQTLGLRLILALTEQLGGILELSKRPNPVFTIRFPMEDT